MQATERVFYRHWILANGWCEAAGLGTTFLLGRLVAPTLGRMSGVAPVLMGAVAAVLMGTLLEGVVVGIAQGQVLASRVTRLKIRVWTGATALGAGLAWLFGMVPSTLFALSRSPSAASQSAEPGAVIQYALAGALGLVAGPILGAAQSVVLRRFVPRAERWLWANAAAWAVGMPLIFAGMDLVPWTGHPAAMAAAVYAVCGVAGITVGAIHGRILVRLLRSSSTARSSR